MLLKAGFALMLTLVAGSAVAAESYPKSYCNGLGTRSQVGLSLAKLRHKTPITSLPLSIEPTTELLQKHETVIIVAKENGFVCIQAIDRRPGYRGSTGWIEASHIEMLPTASYGHEPSWWMGYWRDGASKILFQMRDHQFWASGASQWQGRADPHFGDFQGHPIRKEGYLRINSGDENPATCTLEMIAIGSRIAVRDNNGCGGTNVSFAGVYTRWHPRPVKVQ